MRNYFASSLRKGKSNVIGVVIPFMDSAFFSSAVRGIEEVVHREGFNVMICQSQGLFEREVECVETMLSAGAAAVAISVSSEVRNGKHISRASEMGVPVILFDRVTPTLGQHLVLLDDFSAAYQAVEHLVDQGYRRIAFLVGNRKINVYAERFRGYQEALKAYELGCGNNYIIEVDSKLEDGKEAAKKLLSLPEPPDAILSTDDFSALGALQVARDEVRIPQDMGIIGFSNEPFTEYVSPSLSTIDQQSHKMGMLVGKSCMDFQSESADMQDQLKTFLNPILMVRDSTNRKKFLANA